MKTTYILAAAIAGLAIGYLLAGMGKEPDRQTEKATARDTVIVRDTVRLTPAPVKEYVTRIIHDTVRIETVTDTVAIASLPISRRVYEDSTYHAVVSGYRPQLDSIVLFPPREVITEQIVVPCTVRVKPRFSIGLQIGYGTDFRRFSPYIGIGVQWNILSR